jgi:hypothetical protein
METQLGGGKRKRNENWIDPLNPHDRERNGVVGSLLLPCFVSHKARNVLG